MGERSLTLACVASARTATCAWRRPRHRVHLAGDSSLHRHPRGPARGHRARRAPSSLVACNLEMGVEGRARRGAMQGAKHSDAQWHREHLQRRSVPVSRGQRLPSSGLQATKPRGKPSTNTPLRPCARRRATHIEIPEMKIVCIGGGPSGRYFGLLMKLQDPSNEIVVVERNRPYDTFGWGVVFSTHDGNLREADPVWPRPSATRSTAGTTSRCISRAARYAAAAMASSASAARSCSTSCRSAASRSA